jgi:hypothetical protein
LNVRAGPGTEYPAIGGLPAGQSAQVTGKNPEGTWWQIVYPPESGGRGWVSADAKYSTASNAGGVPVVEVPLLPTYTPTSTGTPTPIPTATPTPTLIPSATPIPAKPTIYTFTADRYTINAGESVTLHWDLANAKVAYLLYDSVQEGVVAPGNKTVSPASTTVYTLLARNDAGDTTAQLTITVNAPPPPVTHSTGLLDIPQTWPADLDEGVVGAGTASDIWFEAVTAAERYVTPRNGATMAKVGTTAVGRSDCAAAPLSASRIHVNDLPEGTYVCVRTNQGRYSEFRVNAPIGPSPGTLKIGYTTWE